MKRDCFFEDYGFGPCVFRADGKPDKAHLIPAQRIRIAGLAAAALDPRIIVNACRKHHHLFDMGTLRLPYSRYPKSVHEFAAEHNFFWAGDRSGWLKGKDRAAA